MLVRHPFQILEKAWVQGWHFLRPEGLHALLQVERSLEGWRYAGLLLLDDLPLLLLIPLFAVYLVARRPGPTLDLIRLWAGFYLCMVTVVSMSASMPSALVIAESPASEGDAS